MGAIWILNLDSESEFGPVSSVRAIWILNLDSEFGFAPMRAIWILNLDSEFGSGSHWTGVVCTGRESEALRAAKLIKLGAPLIRPLRGKVGSGCEISVPVGPLRAR